jgi:outer membrane protein OmpA-like peptidoglycan-associated protein
LTVFALPLSAACAPQRLRTEPQPGATQQSDTIQPLGQDLVVLLPDPNNGIVGRAAVSNGSGAVELEGARASTRVAGNQPPESVTVMRAGDVQRLFGGVLSSLPPAAAIFTLNFPLESDELTRSSRARFMDVVQAIKSRPFAEVVVIGHTDTTGTSAGNYQLGLKRAETVRALLVAAGLDASFVELASHGEADLRVRTGDDVLEPRNRRVEIMVR